MMDDDVDYKGWALELCSLLDAVELALREGNKEGAAGLLSVRFQIAEKFGLRIMPMGQQAGGTQ